MRCLSCICSTLLVISAPYSVGKVLHFGLNTSNKLRSSSKRPMIRREWEAIAKEVQQLTSETRLLQDSL